ncbi:MAG: hypothetical protein NVSMB9_02700 [Isosphaeraceae bacterium]
MRAWRLRTRMVLAVLVPPFVMTFAYVSWAQYLNNFGTIETAHVFRAGQMNAETLGRTLRQRRIKTVLNLRGLNAQQAWYRAERTATIGAGAAQVDLALSSSEWISRARLRTLVRILDSSEYPMLIHCQWGSDRTGLASAVVALLRPGGTLEDARRQFSTGYLYVRAGDGKVMAEHLDQYEGWLRDQGLSHTSGRFRLWVEKGYRPGQPSREQWPYDPHPLVVITRPPRSGFAGAAMDRPLTR